MMVEASCAAMAGWASFKALLGLTFDLLVNFIFCLSAVVSTMSIFGFDPELLSLLLLLKLNVDFERGRFWVSIALGRRGAE